MVDSIQVAVAAGTPLPAEPKGAETTAAFPVASKVITSNLSGKGTLPTKLARLTQNL
jgi:hypothetical protein